MAGKSNSNEIAFSFRSETGIPTDGHKRCVPNELRFQAHFFLSDARRSGH